MKFLVLLYFTFILILSYVQTQQPQNPCPQYFSYQYDGSKYYGLLQVPPIKIGENINIKVHLSIASALINVSSMCVKKI